MSEHARRTADLAGTWYPGSAASCAEQIAAFARATDLDPLDCRLAIAPHAGWRFSGRLAYAAIAHLAQRGDFDTVVLFAGHLGAASPPTLLRGASYETPFGDILGDRELEERLASTGIFSIESAKRHSQDNSTEVLLPLLKHLLPATRVVVVGVPPTEQALDIAETLLAAETDLGRTLAYLGSTDLTHYGANFRFTPKGVCKAAEDWVREENDATYIKYCLALESAAAIRHAQDNKSACCPGAAAAVTHIASLEGAQSKLLSYATSNDVDDGPGTGSFVGYAAMTFADKAPLSGTHPFGEPS